VTGELVVTSIGVLSGLLTPVLVDFQQQHPGLVVRFLTDLRLFRLDYGEAHVAIRAGAAPEEPDNVVQPFVRLRTGLYAARSYAEAHGLPASPAEFAAHSFVGADEQMSRAPFHRWLREAVPAEAIIYRATESSALDEAVRAGAGIGFLAAHEAAGDPDLVEVMPPQPEWDSQLWLVTHVDLHRTLKVQSFLNHLKQAAATWQSKWDQSSV
jgi:DNA-binding transcriptional LysR family regulator